tara:strand:- start:254 stop:556 length:303 start_codon:yes stop_codon:yes gene_type:complete
MKITVYNNDVSKAYRILQKKLNSEGTLRELKEKEFFTSKGEKKRLDRKRGIVRYKKQEKKRLIALEKAELRAFKQRKFNQKNGRQSPPHNSTKIWKKTKK